MGARIIRAVSRASSLLLLSLFCSCGNVVFHDFCSVGDGWSSSDTLTFVVCNPLAGSSICEAYIELRSTPHYPYRKLWLSARTRHSKSNNCDTDTICCEIFDSIGQHKGTTAGLLYQTRHRIAPMELLPDDTVTIELTHIMDECVNGVYDVGIRVERVGRHLP